MTGRKINLTDSDGQQLSGYLPTGWHETPLAAYAQLASATTMGQQCEAVAQLLGLPAAPFLEDVSLLLPVRHAAPWLFDGSLPEGPEAIGHFTHQGTVYAHVGSLDKITAEQMEALLSFLSQHESKPLLSAPHLLAVLYCPAGRTQSADMVESVARAFASLPMSTAWPALADFLRSGASAALHIRTVWALEKQAKTILETLEVAVTTDGDSRISFSNMRRWLTRRWVRAARKML